MPRRKAGGKAAAKPVARGKAAAQPKVEEKAVQAAGPVSQTLPSKEQAMFKTILKLYEQKQYKRGLKTCDTVLKKFPNHGETLSMKGLLLNAQNKKEEAFTFVRLGLKNNLKSYVCWHVYGLLYRSDKNYVESIKCYQQALRVEKTNFQILRDLATLQIQVRSLQGFQESRNEMLTQKPETPGNWAGFAVAAHLNGNLKLSEKVLDSFIGTLDEERKREKEKRRIQKEQSESGNNSSRAKTAKQKQKEKLKLMYEQKKKEKEKEAGGEDDEALRKEAEETAAKEEEERLLEGLEFDYSEVLLYRNMVIEEQGELDRALQDLNKIEKDVVDRYALQEKRALLLLRLNRLSEAAKYYKELLLSNAESYDYHRGLQQALGHLPVEDVVDATVGKTAEMGAAQKEVIQNAGPGTSNTTTSATPSIAYFVGRYENVSNDTVDALDKLYTTLQELVHPRCDAVRCIPLHFLRGERFASAFEAYVQPKLRKGVSSLFNSVRSLYSNKEKVAAIEKSATAIISSLEDSSTFPGGEKKESPSVLMWSYYFLANHYDCLGDYTRAMAELEKAIEHTPTMIDLYLCKGRIYSHAGDAQRAAYWLDYSRKLDLADRYLNTKCTKFMLRADRIEDADRIVTLFTKDGDTTLFDMQCMWYELEVADSHVRTAKFNLALKQFTNVLKHFEDIEEDQLDFHTYSLRKLALRSYVGMLRMEDEIKSHQNFLRAGAGIVEVYLHLHDHPESGAGKEGDEFAGLSEDEKKKAIKKQKRAEARRLAQGAAAPAAAEKGKAAAETTKNGKPVDEDADGMALLKVEQPLQEALKYYRKFENSCRDRIKTHQVGFELYQRLGRPLLMLRCVYRAIAVSGADHPLVHMLIVRFFHAVDGELGKSISNATVKSVVEEARKELLKDAKVSEYNDKYGQEAQKDDLRRICSFSEMSALLDESAKKAAAEKVVTAVSSLESNPNRTVRSILSLKDYVRAYELVGGKLGNEEMQKTLKEISGRSFPLSTFFNDIPEFKEEEEEEADKVELEGEKEKGKETASS